MNISKNKFTVWRIVGFIFLSLYGNLVITFNLLSQQTDVTSIAGQWTDTNQLIFKATMGAFLFILCEIAAFGIFAIEDKR